MPNTNQPAVRIGAHVRVQMNGEPSRTGTIDHIDEFEPDGCDAKYEITLDGGEVVYRGRDEITVLG